MYHVYLQDIILIKKKKVKNIKDDQDVQGVIQMLVKYELSLWQVCLEDQGGVSSNVYLQDINMMKNEEMKHKGFRTWLIIVETSYNSEHVLSNEEMECKFKISIKERSYA